MNNPKPPYTAPVVRAALDAAAAAAAALVSNRLGEPEAALGSAITSAGAAGVLQHLHARYDRRRLARVDRLLTRAARIADVPVEDLLDRFEADYRLEDLFVRTLRVAQECALEDKLVALAISLATACSSADESTGAWEAAFVRAIDDCDLAHIAMLHSFSRTAAELGLAHGEPTKSEVLDGLNSVQLEMVHPEFVMVLDALVATAQRHGLLSASTTLGGLSASTGPANTRWRLTAFGASFLERLDVVREAMTPPGQDGSRL